MATNPFVWQEMRYRDALHLGRARLEWARFTILKPLSDYRSNVE